MAFQIEKNQHDRMDPYEVNFSALIRKLISIHKCLVLKVVKSIKINQLDGTS